MAQTKDLPVKQTTKADISKIEDVQKISRSDAFDLMENADPAELQKLSGADYLKMEVGEKKVFEFTGNTVFMANQPDGSKKSTPAVKLVDKEGGEFIMATTMVVQSLQAVTELPCYVRLTYKGKKTAAKSVNVYDDYEIEVFPQQVKQSAPTYSKDGLPF